MRFALSGLAAFSLLVLAPGCGGPAGSSEGAANNQGGAGQAAASPEDDWPSALLREPPPGDRSPALETSADAPAATPPAIPLGGKFELTAPETWVRKAPRSEIIEHEFAVPAAEGDAEGGRVTVMAAGGSVEDNVKRWYGQFDQPDGADTAGKAKKEEKEAAGCKVVLVDVSGTYKEARGGGPFAPGPVVELPGYRMLAAIVQTPGANYFVKFTGPEKTVGAQAEAFRRMIDGLRAK